MRHAVARRTGTREDPEAGHGVRPLARAVRPVLVLHSVIAGLILLGLAPAAASASPGTYDVARAPGVLAIVDCARGTGFVEVGNTDMAGSTVEVILDGARQPDIHVDSGGLLREWYFLEANQPHRLTIVYDFVPGNAEEENQVMTASCLDGAPTPTEGEPTMFTPVPPSRVWDSRSGPGPTGRVGAGQTRDITVTGVGHVPLTGVTAVVLNITAVSPTAPTYVTAWPSGQTRPLASNLNVPAGDVRANLVIARVGPNGMVSVYNDSGNVDLVADITGYYGTAAS